MKPTKIGLLYNKSKSIVNEIRVLFFKYRGLNIGTRSFIGKITCDWPNRLKIGNDCKIQDSVDFRIYQPYNENSNIKIGNNVFIGHACEFVCSNNIEIRNNCLIASKTTFNDTGHEFSKLDLINIQPITSGEIIIEEDVWIGTSCVILKGVTIGEGSVIAAGSVVNKSIPPYQVWAGVPARFIKNRN